MKLLLTSTGITNDSIAIAFDGLTGMARSKVMIGFVPTAANAEPGKKDWFLRQIFDLNKFGYTNIDFVDFSASGFNWQERLNVCDVVYVSGGNTFHLLNETRKNGFDKWIKENIESKIYVGTSAGSILATPTIAIATVEPADTNYAEITDLTALNLVDFEISPHSPEQLSFEINENYAKTISNKLYAIDDNTAIKVINGNIEIITKGKWKVFK
ncbi:MAG: hypothetical protein A3I20_01960 [Candidatus Portnoybacteria bacterium RIFCSPLOWO2_02_FULL_40_15]|uniref:Peptidase S51 n=1 Tax=Candidatus Portnoybacteria bacterium RIFCSPLOWO2_02_FULL_40_15 TaxID=1802002 RepID=A0A1G2FQQ3_9BACT|nr:MAG: hypothetical protein A3I20_01960 [Candidatus Portnoybacteria bacterium RIFCSPLOWO2_02_FULL_40_15]